MPRTGVVAAHQEVVRGAVHTRTCIALHNIVILFRDTDDSSKSEDDTDEDQGGIWCSIFNEAITKKEPQQLSLVPFGREVPPCRAWSNTDDDRTRSVLGTDRGTNKPLLSLTEIGLIIRSCLILPLISHGVSEKVVGVLVAGVNPRHELDDIYRYVSHLGMTLTFVSTLTSP